MALRTPAFNDAKTYGFEWVRAMIEADSQEGVLNFGGAGTDLKVTAAAGGGMKVDIAAGAALIKGDSGVPATGLTQGLFLAVNDAAVANALTLAASHATLPRISRICLKVRDSADLGTGADDLTFVEVAGAPTSGATLDNESGAAALPNDHIQLSTILVPAASVAVSAANVRDRRRWAKGGLSKIVRTAANYTTTSSTVGDIDSTNLAIRMECSGSPLRVGLKGLFSYSVVSAFAQWQIVYDGATKAAGADAGEAVATTQVPLSIENIIIPPAGSHLFKPQNGVNISPGGTLTTYANINNQLLFYVEELVRPDANNGTA